MGPTMERTLYLVVFARNPVHDINERIDHSFVTNILANAYVEFDIAKDFTFRSSVGSNLLFNKRNRYMLVTTTL